MRIIFVMIFCAVLAGCTDGEYYAPVMDISHMEDVPSTGKHRVMAGETLYSIAWRYGLDYRYVAKRNQISAPYTIFTGQTIYLRGQTQHVVTAQPVSSVIAREPTRHQNQIEPREPHYSSSGWRWPTRGKIIRYYSAQNKGVNIAGTRGQPVYAAAAGKVVYSGNGLRGYGNLIIIKHNTLMLSAYAHNAKMLVREGKWVDKGQKIAEMGDSGADKVMLHYEIRRAGKPVNPLTLYRGKEK